MNKKFILILLVSLCLVSTLTFVGAAGYSTETFKITNDTEDYILKAPGFFEDVHADSISLVSTGDSHNIYTFYEVGTENSTLNPVDYLYNDSNTIVEAKYYGNLTVYKVLTDIKSDDFSGEDNYQTYAVYTKDSHTYYAFTPYYANGDQYDFSGRQEAEIFSHDCNTLKGFFRSIEPIK